MLVLANQSRRALVGMTANFVPIMYCAIALLSQCEQLNIPSYHFVVRVEIKCQGCFGKLRLDPPK